MLPQAGLHTSTSQSELIPSQHHQCCLQLLLAAGTSSLPTKASLLSKGFSNTSNHITKDLCLQLINELSVFVVSSYSFNQEILNKTVNVDFLHQELNYCETMTIIMQWKNPSLLSLHQQLKDLMYLKYIQDSWPQRYAT